MSRRKVLKAGNIITRTAEGKRLPWQSRRLDSFTSGEAEDPSQELTDDQLEASIRERGLIQDPGVWLRDGVYWCLWGFRRVEACQRIGKDYELRAIVHTDITQLEARGLNLGENLNRRSLRPWEIAEALTEALTEDPEMKPVELAREFGLSRKYVANLVRVRTKAAPEIWEQFRRWGMSLRISYNDLLKLVTLPHDEQIARWQELVASREKPIVRGKEKRPGPAKLKKLLAKVPALESSRDFRKGVAFGLRVALGEERFPAAKVKEDR